MTESRPRAICPVCNGQGGYHEPGDAHRSPGYVSCHHRSKTHYCSKGTFLPITTEKKKMTTEDNGVKIDADWTPPSKTLELPWDKLELNKGSFMVPGTKTSQLSSARQRAERDLGRQFKTKLEIKDNESFIRVWRVK